MTDDKKALKKSDQVVTREIEGEVILLPLYKASKDLNFIYTLNETAAAVWKQINGKRTLSEIGKEIQGEFEVSDKVLEKNLKELVKDLKGIKALV